MERYSRHRALAALGAAALLAAMPVKTSALEWDTVVNNGDVMPGSTKLFNSYNQPSVNASGRVVLRARSKGPQQPTRGIYTRDMLDPRSPIVMIAEVGSQVPEPNNLDAAFNEFPAFPRIGIGLDAVAFRGQSQPVWTFVLPDSTETRIGTSGVYTNPTGALTAGASQLGGVSGFERFQVPGAAAGTRFDQFPGAPAITGGSVIVFKGNYTEDGVGKTGVYFRRVLALNGAAPVRRIADTGTRIPNQPAGGRVTFGSTAPPSAAAGQAVFAGFDNEESPTLGGIYRAPLRVNPPLKTLVGIGSAVPGEAGQRFNRFGEALSFDGRHVGFWGAWGSETRTRLLLCPQDGNAAVIAFCLQQHPNGFEAAVPVHQGIFVHDTLTGRTRTIAKTGRGFDDFLFWVFSGRAPGAGEGEGEDFEPPRWRSSAFSAVSGTRVAFKASIGEVQGIHVRLGTAPATTLVDTTMSGQALDPEAPAGATVIALGVERDGFRNGWLAINASMLDDVTGASWAGIYLTRIAFH